MHETLIKRFLKYTYVAPQQNVSYNIQIINPHQENTMFEFEKQYKQFEELQDRIKEVNEFWVQSTLSAIKEIFKLAKVK